MDGNHGNHAVEWKADLSCMSRSGDQVGNLARADGVALSGGAIARAAPLRPLPGIGKNT
jgi:hypothetical protein